MILPATEPYPCRETETQESALMRRRDPVVWGAPHLRPAWLPEAAVRNYEASGVVIFPGFFSATEISTFNAEMKMLLARYEEAGEASNVIREGSSGAIRSIFDLPSISPVLDKLTRHPRLLAFAQYVLDDEVYLHQTRLNYKPAFHGKEFYWHSDFETWHVEDGMPAMRAISCIVLLTENNAFNAPLMVVPGSHKVYVTCVGETPPDNYRYSLVSQTVGTPSEEWLRLLTNEAGGLQSITGAAGTVAFFDCNLLHGSASNITPYPRSNVFMVYNSVNNKLKSPMKGLHPRPEHIAHRRKTATLKPFS